MTATTRGAHCAGVGCGHGHSGAGPTGGPGSEPVAGAERATTPNMRSGTRLRGRRAAKRRDRVSTDLAALGSGRRVATPITAL